MGFHLLNAPTEHLRHNDEYFFARYGILVSKSTLKFARYTNEVSKISKRENSLSFVFFFHAMHGWLGKNAYSRKNNHLKEDIFIWFFSMKIPESCDD